MRKHIPMLLLLLVSGFVLNYDVQSDFPIHIDEPAWVASGDITFNLYKNLASQEAWKTAYSEHKLGPWGHKNPPFGKLLVGMMIAPAKTTKERFVKKWKWKSNYRANHRLGNLPPYRIMRAGRFGMMLLGLATLFLCYLISFQFTGSAKWSLLAPAFLFFVPIFRIRSIYIYTDIPQVLFVLLSLYLTMKYLKSRKAVFFALSALCAGLSCAIKFNSAPIVAANALILLFASKSIARKLTLSALAGLIPIFVFVAVNPYLYSQPIKKTMGIIAWWKQLKIKQKKEKAVRHQAVNKKSRALLLVLKRTLFNPWSQPPVTNRRFLAGLHTHIGKIVLCWLVFMVAWWLFFQVTLQKVSLAWRYSVLTSALLGVGGYVLFFGELGGLSSSLIILGIASSCLPKVWNHHEQHQDRDDQVWELRYLLLTFVVFSIFSVLWLPFDWAHYYLPVLIFLPFYFVFGTKLLLQGVLVSTREKPLAPKAVPRRIAKPLLIVLSLVVIAGTTTLTFESFVQVRKQYRSAKLTPRTPIAKLLKAWDAENNQQKKIVISTYLMKQAAILGDLKGLFAEADFVLKQNPKPSRELAQLVNFALKTAIEKRMEKQARKYMSLGKKLFRKK